MTELELITALAAAFNNYDAGRMGPLLHDTTFHFFSQSSFNEFDSKHEFLDFTAHAFETMKAEAIEIAAELAYTGHQPAPAKDSISNIQMLIRSGVPCIYLTYTFPKAFEAPYFVSDVDEPGQESLIRPMTNVHESVVCVKIKDGLISEVSFQLPRFYGNMRRTGEYPGR